MAERINDAPAGLEHDPRGDAWERHAGGDKRDREADKAVRDAMRREQDGEYDPDGNFRPSSWKQA